MEKEPFEFYCNDCHGWFIVHLNTSIRGNFIIVCPNCEHEHPRTIEDGQMLERVDSNNRFTDFDNNRYNSKTRVVIRNHTKHKHDRIIPLKSAYSKKPRLHQLEKVRGGFLAESWVNKASGEKHG
jgi:hypothetical protein